jgi:predicted nucleotidyltransferase
LREQGVTHAALFGSVARGAQQAECDIDIMVELDPEIVRTIFDYVGVKEFIFDIFGGSVDVVRSEALKTVVRARVGVDAIYGF